VLNAKNVKIAFASVETEIIDDMLYIVLKDGRKIELPLYAEWCDFDPTFGNVYNDLFLYDNAHYGLLTFGVGDKYGYIDLETGKVACEPKWDWVSLFRYGGYALIGCGGVPATDEDMAYEMPPGGTKIGLIDENFNVVVPPEYDYVEWLVSFNIDKCGSRYCNVGVNGHRVREFNLNRKQPPDKEWFVVYKDRECGIIDRKGNVVIPMSWGTLHVLNRNCIIRSGDVTLYTRGQTIPLDKVYVCAAKHDERVYFIAKKGRKYAVIRDNGTFASDFKFSFEQARQFVDIQFNGRTLVGKLTR